MRAHPRPRRRAHHAARPARRRLQRLQSSGARLSRASPKHLPSGRAVGSEAAARPVQPSGPGLGSASLSAGPSLSRLFGSSSCVCVFVSASLLEVGSPRSRLRAGHPHVDPCDLGYCGSNFPGGLYNTWSRCPRCQSPPRTLSNQGFLRFRKTASVISRHLLI